MSGENPRLGLDRFPYVNTRDLDQARQAYAGVYGDHSLDLGGDVRRFEWRTNVIDVGPIGFARSACRGQTFIRGEPRSYIVNMVRGSATASVHEAPLLLSSGRSAVVFSPTGAVSLDYEDDVLTTTVRIDTRFLESELTALTGVTPRTPVHFAPHLRTDQGTGASVERMFLFLIGELDRGSEALSHPLVVRSLCDALVRELLLGQPHDHAHLLEKAAPSSSRGVVWLVEGYLEAHAAEPVRIADLVALTGSSMRAIEAAFRLYRGWTPGAFLRGKRLDLARRRLLGPDPGATVMHVAHASGFLRRARFDAAYLRQFGETPEATRTRGLVAVTAPSRRRPTPAVAAARAVVFVVDPEPSTRSAVAGLLRDIGHEVEAFASAASFLAAAGPAPAGCAVLDLHLPDLSGIEVQAALRASGCALPLVFVTGDGTVPEAVDAMKGGAVDVLRRPFGDDALLAAVERALALAEVARRERGEREALAARFAALSAREREVCEAVARGLLNKQIAGELGITERTVKEYRARGMEKLGVTSAAELGRVLERQGGRG